MDLSQYAELFLAESREHLSACNQLLLDWERSPANLAPVGGLFRAVHTVKGMAATMGYARVTDLAHRAENLLDLVRRGGRPATDDLLQLLFRARDALEHAVELSVVEREDEIDVAEVVADLEGAAAHLGRGGEAGGGIGARTTPVPAPAPVVDTPAAAGRLVQVTLRAEAPLKGGRALLVIKKVQAVGPVHAVTPPESAFEADEFDGRFSFRIGGAAGVAEIERAVRAAGEVEHVTVGGEERRPAPGAGALPAAPETKSRHIRVDLGRLDGLMDLIGELVTVRGRLNELAANARDPAIDDVAIQVSRLSRELQAEIIQARMTPVWQVFDRFPRLVRDLARELGKQVAFRVEGKEIELDRAILDELGDPLLHLLRNAVDHGVESPADRRRRGKKPEGEIVLAAVRERASVAISVRDDGRGIDRKQILERAKRDGVVDPHAEALIAGVGAERYALPLTYVAETVEFGVQATTIVEGREAIVLRDRVVPLVHLRRLLGVSGDAPTRCPIIVLEMGERRSGIVVDGMLGQQEIVVKGFDAPHGTLPVFSGATIMGDGVPTLILDAGGLL